MTDIRFYPDRKDMSYYEHYHRYLFAAIFSAEKSILDVSCGEGYGSYLLSMCARDVTGLDIDHGILRHARKKYRAKNLHFVHGDCRKLPFADHSFDRVISFET